MSGLVSVIMGMHRIDAFVDQAIYSVLRQSYKNFEFIIIANGNARDDVCRYINDKFKDNRLILLSTEVGGLAHALNVGISASRGGLVARMDADDIMHVERLTRQVEFLSENNLDVVGSGANLIDINGNVVGKRIMPNGSAIDKMLPYKNPFIHPSVLYRKKVVIDAKGYNSGLNSEDYDLWLRLSRLGVRWDNVGEALLDYRIHSNSSQGSRNAYAECAGYALREFCLRRNLKNFGAIFSWVFKSLVRSK